MEDEEELIESEYIRIKNMKVAMTRARLPDFVPSDHDVHGVAWLDGEPHPGMVIMANKEFVEYTDLPGDYFENVKESQEMANKAKMTDEQIQKNYERALKSNPDLTLEGYIEMQEKQAAQKAQKTARKAKNKRIKEAKEEAEKAFEDRLEKAAKRTDHNNSVVVDYMHELCCYMTIEFAAQALYGDVEDFDESLEAVAEMVQEKMIDNRYFDDPDYYHMIRVNDADRKDGYIRGPHSTPNPRENGEALELDSVEPIMEMKSPTGNDNDSEENESNVVVEDVSVDELDESLNQANEDESNLEYLERVGKASDEANAIRNSDQNPTKLKADIESDKETVSLEDAAKMLGPIAPEDMEAFQAQMRASRVQDNFHKSLKAYAETLWGPFGGLGGKMDEAIKEYAVERWGPFAADVPSPPMPEPKAACEKVVEEFTPEETVKEALLEKEQYELGQKFLKMPIVYVLTWKWHYGEESKEFTKIGDALNYPATIIAHFSEFNFSDAGWNLFSRRQGELVQVEGELNFKFTLDKEKKNG